MLVGYLVLAVGLALLAGFLDAHGLPGLVAPLVVFDVLTLFAFTLVGPALVLSPRFPPPDGPPRGGLVPFPLRTPDAVNEAADEPSQAA